MHGQRLTGLDGLRAIAALSVILFHALAWQSGAQRGNAYLAVDFFFMLSGYVMARTYEDKLATSLSPATFLYGRFCRFWPTLFVAGLIGLPWFLVSFGVDQWGIAALNLLLIPTFQFVRLYPLNSPAWSILLELFANLLHTLVLRRLSTTTLVITVIAMAPLLAMSVSRISFDIGAMTAAFLPALMRVTFSYMIGIILWRWWRDRPSIAVPPALAFLIMPLFFSVATWFDVDSWQSGFLFILVACPLMLAGGLRWSGPAHEPTARAMTWGGAMSFPVYALHTPICMTVTMAGWPVAWGILPTFAAAYLFTRPNFGVIRHIVQWKRARALA
ncbi:acyltransferase [Sphingobium terrigena]|uniref:Acyltransferase n=1 Tax=Sphingobium terrigena TaxID=2304063 RepID=A0A418YRU5_9SPHN|nr:acyltransferase [Sphingobium terrigena]RJG54417.1 acyltransferase [Sphingobium terrigena]